MTSVIAFLILLGSSVIAPQAPQRGPARQATALVTGLVRTPNGSPAPAGVRVGALDAASVSGGSTIMATTQTSSDGSYRLEELPPGRYYIFAGPLDIPTYFPGGTELGKASIVTVAAGQTLDDVNVTLEAATVHGFKVSGRVTTSEPGSRPREGLIVSMRPNGGSQVNTTIKADGAFEFVNIRPGRYFIQTDIEAPGMDLGFSPIRFVPVFSSPPLRDRDVTVSDKDVTGIELTVPHSVEVKGTVRTGPDFPLPELVEIGGSGRIPIGDDGTFRVILLEGRYPIRITGLPPYTYLKSVTAGSTDLLRDPLELRPEDSTVLIVAVLAKSELTRISGRVTRNSGERPAQIELRDALSPDDTPFPSKPDTDSKTTAVAAINPDGTFAFGSVRPGTHQASFVLDSGLRVPIGPVFLPAENASRLELSMPPLYEIAGRVLVDGGDPPPQFILAVSGGPTGEFKAMSDLAIKASLLGSDSVIHSDLDDILTDTTIYVNVAPLPDGSFRFALPAGDYDLSFPGFRLSPTSHSVRSVTQGGVSLNLRLKVGPAGDKEELRLTFALQSKPVKVVGRVNGLDPALAGAARVSLGSVDVAPIEAPISADGTFEFPKVPFGNYTPRVLPAQPFDPMMPYVVRSADVAPLIIDIPKVRKIRGRVRVEGPGPLIGFPVLLRRDISSVASVFVNPNADGSFEIPAPDGMYRVSVGDLPLRYTGRILEDSIEVSAASTPELRVMLISPAGLQTLALGGRVVGVNPGSTRIILTGQAVAANYETAIENGRFLFPSLLPGVYSVTLVRDGNVLAVEPAFVVVASPNQTDIQLRVSQTTGAVDRSGRAPHSSGASILPSAPIRLMTPSVTQQLNSDEFSALVSLRIVHEVEVRFAAVQFATLPELLYNVRLKTRFRDPVSGYRISIVVTGSDYISVATPIDSTAGGYVFYGSSNGVIRYSVDERFAPRGLAGQPVR